MLERRGHRADLLLGLGSTVSERGAADAAHALLDLRSSQGKRARTHEVAAQMETENSQAMVDVPTEPHAQDQKDQGQRRGNDQKKERFALQETNSNREFHAIRAKLILAASSIVNLPEATAPDEREHIVRSCNRADSSAPACRAGKRRGILEFAARERASGAIAKAARKKGSTTIHLGSIRTSATTYFVVPGGCNSNRRDSIPELRVRLRNAFVAPPQGEDGVEFMAGRAEEATTASKLRADTGAPTIRASGIDQGQQHRGGRSTA